MVFVVSIPLLELQQVNEPRALSAYNVQYSLCRKDRTPFYFYQFFNRRWHYQGPHSSHSRCQQHEFLHGNKLDIYRRGSRCTNFVCKSKQ